MKRCKFSVVLYLPKQVEKEAKRITKMVSKKCHTYASAKKWDPHITVGGGIIVKENQLNQLINDLNEFVVKQRRVKVRINGIGFSTRAQKPFRNPYVIFMKVILNQKLKILYQNLKSKILKKFPKWHKIVRYQPHLTIAFDDLTRAKFKAAAKFLKEIKYNPKFEFYIDNISLLHFNKSKKKWVPFKIFRFKK